MRTQQKREKLVSNRTDSSVSVDEKVKAAVRGPFLFPTYLGRSKGLCSQVMLMLTKNDLTLEKEFQESWTKEQSQQNTPLHQWTNPNTPPNKAMINEMEKEQTGIHNWKKNHSTFDK